MYIQIGANPDTKTIRGNSLLHLLSSDENNENGKNNQAINELVEIFKANIDIKNAKIYKFLNFA